MLVNLKLYLHFLILFSLFLIYTPNAYSVPPLSQAQLTQASMGQTQLVQEGYRDSLCSICNLPCDDNDQEDRINLQCPFGHTICEECLARQMKYTKPIETLKEGVRCWGENCDYRYPLKSALTALSHAERTDIETKLQSAKEQKEAQPPSDDTIREEEKISIQVQEAFIRHCPNPNCNVALDSNVAKGCNSTQCDRCNTHFCNICLKKFSSEKAMHAHLKEHPDPNNSRLDSIWFMAREKLDQISFTPETRAYATRINKELLEHYNMWPLPAGIHIDSWINSVLSELKPRNTLFKRSKKAKIIRLLKNEIEYRYSTGKLLPTFKTEKTLKKIGLLHLFDTFRYPDLKYADKMHRFEYGPEIIPKDWIPAVISPMKRKQDIGFWPIEALPQINQQEAERFARESRENENSSRWDQNFIRREPFVPKQTTFAAHFFYYGVPGETNHLGVPISQGSYDLGYLYDTVNRKLRPRKYSGKEFLGFVRSKAHDDEILGEAWIDQKANLLWYLESEVEASLSEARRYCSENSARLPDYREVAGFGDFNNKMIYRWAGKLAHQFFWMNDHRVGNAFTFQGKFARSDDYPREHVAAAVTCVRPWNPQ